MPAVQTIKAEIIRLQQADLIPSIVGSLDSAGSAVKSEVKAAIARAQKNAHFGFTPDVVFWLAFPYDDVFSYKIKLNSIAFWEKLLECIVATMPDDKVQSISPNCPRAIGKAVFLKRLPKNFLKRQKEREMMESLPQKPES